MSRKVWFTLLTLIGIVAATACSAEPTSSPTTADMPNPASVFCEENGGKLEIRQDAAGGAVGICVFPDGSECEEWAYMRGECQPQSAVTPAEPASTTANMPNPASVFCEENGGKLEIRQDASGGAVGICIFPDGSECDEWAYFRGECQPQSANMPNPASVFCEENGGKLEIRQDATGGAVGICVFPDGSECDEWAYFRGECQPQSAATAEMGSDGWKIYRNETLGYMLHYPADAVIEFADDPQKTLTILGPMVNDEHWPVIYVNHPSDREDYRPPEGVDLAQWLIDHNLLVETRLPDVQIAGTTAVHTRHDRSPQSYAADTFFFAHEGQLYSVVILHTGDKEDWEVYNHFLSNIQFTP